MITCLLLLESLLAAAISTSERTPPEWTRNFILFIRRKQFGFMFLEKAEDKENNDENVLIESREITNSSNNKMWRDICLVLDKAALLIITVLYVIFSLTLIPLNYALNSNPIKIVI